MMVGVSSCGGVAGGLACWPWRARAASPAVSARVVRNGLLSRSIIALFPEWTKGRHAARLHQPNHHVPVFPIVFAVHRRITENVLVSQFDSDLGGDVRQLVQVVHGVLASAGLLGDLGQQSLPGSFFGGAPARGHRLVNS